MSNMDKKNVIQFKLLKITTDQFAIIDDLYNYGDKHNLDIAFYYGKDDTQKIITSKAKFTFTTKKGLFLIIEGSCHFNISDASWKDLTVNETSIKLDKEFLAHITTLTVGTVRGILHAKTEDTIYNSIYIPLINVEKVITEDLIIE